MKNRFYKELVYKRDILKNIIEKRRDKYLVPVRWYWLSDSHIKLPNASRGYRKDYTDWIHHGWDIDAPLDSQVISLDDWIIVRVVKEYAWEDLWKIKHSHNLSEDDKLNNLDILRWNQVWLKTAKWDVVFYSHLDNIYSNIKEGEMIKSWTPIWTIWITWIPDKSYTDYHLHFAVHKNPYNINMAWKYSFDDYMRWDWYFKWESASHILDHQHSVFTENNSLSYEEKHSD